MIILANNSKIPVRKQGDVDYDVRFLAKYPGLVKELAERYELSEQEVTQIVGHYFVALKDSFTDWRMPIIVIPQIGSFLPSLGKINWYIKRCLHNYRLGYITKEKLDQRIKSVWPIRGRLKKEKTFTSTTQADDATWKTWRRYGHIYKPEFFDKENNTDAKK